MKIKRIIDRSKHYCKSPKNMSVLMQVLPLIIKRKLEIEIKYFIVKLFKIEMLGPHYKRKLFEFIREDEIYGSKVSQFWQDIVANMTKEFLAKGMKNFRKGNLDRNFTTKSVNKNDLQEYYDKIKIFDKYDILNNLSDPMLGNPKVFIKHNITWDFLESVDEFYYISNKLNLKLSDKINICEIGAGYGRTAWVFLNMMPNSIYNIIDIPHSLFTSYYFIRENFMLKRCNFFLPHQIKEVNKPDLWINIKSFQEMTPEIVDNYLQSIDKIGGKYIYLKNNVSNPNWADDIIYGIDSYQLTPKMKIINVKDECIYDNSKEMIIENR